MVSMGSCPLRRFSGDETALLLFQSLGAVASQFRLPCASGQRASDARRLDRSERAINVPLQGKWGLVLRACFGLAPLAGLEILDGMWTDRITHQAQGGVSDCGSHAPDLAVATLGDADRDP